MHDDDRIRRAMEGEAQAIEALLASQQDRVHRLAARMLGNVEDAREATQDILLRVVTHLSSFRGESRFDTWVYRIAVNHLVRTRRVLERVPRLTFDGFEEDLLDGLADDAAAAPDDDAMLGELRVRCTMALLLCLDADHRVAYVLGEIFELSQAEAVEILEISPAAWRKRLSRARAAVRDATARSCGLVSDQARCTCPRRLPRAQALGRVGRRPSGGLAGAPDHARVVEEARRTEQTLRAAMLQRAAGPLHSPAGLSAAVMRVLVPGLD